MKTFKGFLKVLLVYMLGSLLMASLPYLLFPAMRVGLRPIPAVAAKDGLGDIKQDVEIRGNEIRLTDKSDSLPAGWRISWTADKKTAELVSKTPMTVPEGSIWVYFDPNPELRAKGKKSLPLVQLR